MDIGIVCGYGVALENNLEDYADLVSDFLFSNEIDRLILCGGYTSEKSSYSEASLMKQLLQERGINHKIILEESSVTSLENLLSAKNILDNSDYSITKIYIFCDSIRNLKMFCLSKIIFDRYSVEVISFGRKEFALMYLVQIPSTIIQSLGAIFPQISNTLSASRKKWNKIVDKFFKF